MFAMSSRYNSKSFIEWLEGMMKIKGWGVRETAKQAGVSHPIISDILQGQQPSEKTCVLLAVLFNVSVEYILVLGGHLSPRNIDGNLLQRTLAKEVETLDDNETEEALRYVRFIKERPASKKGVVAERNS